ncbi:MAG: MinD/ParA family protein [Candidatus Eisenbacteria bacterium]
MKRRAPGSQPAGPLRLVTGGSRPDPSPAAEHPSQWSRPHVRSLAIASGKGGVGKSMLAANLAIALGERGARVLLVDADFSQANLDLLLGVHPRWDLQHVLQGEKTLEEIVVQGPAGVRLVPAASGAPELTDLDDYRLESLWRGMSQLENDADVVLIDTASGVHRTVTWLCHAAREVLVVTSPEMPAFSDAYALIKLLHQQGLTQPPHLVVNRADGAEEAEEVAHRLRLVARRFLSLELDLWGSVPADPAVARAQRLQQPLLTAFPQAPVSAAIRALSEYLWDVVPPEPRVQPDTQPQRLEA